MSASESTFKPRFPIETRLFINNEYVDAVSGEPTIDLVNPVTGQQVAKVQVAGKEDVDRAVDAAQAAFPAWSALTGKQRASYLRALAFELKNNEDEIIETEVIAMGKPRGPTAMEQGWSADYLDTLVGQAEAVYGDTSLNQEGFLNISIKQPYGVVAGIYAWNVGTPFWLWKVGPAVAAGNTIVVKASEKSPLQSILFGKFVKAAGFPPGVINVVSGAGATGALLASHMKIRKISFTGSTAAGRKVQQAAAASNLKVVTLELGGKSPSIVFDDADIAKSVETVVLSSLINMGQVCTANTRVYVQDTIAPVFLEHLKQHFSGWTAKQGNPSDPNTLIGTVADAAQVKHVTGLIDSGTSEGGKIAIGGKGQGAFILPTIFTDVKDDSTINVNEVFGPVMVYHTFKTEEEVLKRANASDYALYASVFTQDINRALRVAKGLESGMVGINAASPTLHYDLPFGGWKQSGYGKEMGKDWVAAWTQTKSIYIKTA